MGRKKKVKTVKKVKKSVIKELKFDLSERKDLVNDNFNFDEVINDRLNMTQHLLLVKGIEYVRNDDRFHNFTRAAEMNRTSQTRALHGMLTKHLVSLCDMIDDIDTGRLPNESVVEEKIGDCIVYLFLQEALIKNLIHNNTKQPK